MDAFSAAIDTLFGDPSLARDALWRAGGTGEGTAARVITKKPDQVVGFGDSRAILPTMLIDVRQSEIASPALGDTVEIDTATYEIIATPTGDDLGLIWTCEATLQS